MPVVPNKRGNAWIRGILNIGRQEQMIPVFASMMVHIVEILVAAVWSGAVDENFRVVIRRIDVTQTL